jgi:methyl-accepting chemotaxis protein
MAEKMSDPLEMKFENLKSFFIDYLSLKNKKQYPVLLTYKKYLNNLSDENKKKEIELFEKFLIKNPNIKNSEFIESIFTTGKKPLTLEMKNFSHEEKFWEEIQKLEKNCFPEGKPENIEIEQPEWLKDSIMSDIFKEITNTVNMEEVVKDENLTTTSLFEKPEVLRLAKNIQTKIENGEYTVSNLLTTLTKIISSETIQKDAPSETLSSLNEISETMQDLNEGKNNPNISRLLDLVLNLKMK